MPFGVMMIASVFYPSVGGAQTHTLRLSQKLRARGVDVAVITRHYRGLARYEDVGGVTVYRVGQGDSNKIVAALSYIGGALRVLAAQRRRYAIIHCHQMISPMTIGLLGRALLRRRLVVNPHRSGPIGDIGVLTLRRPITGKLRIGAARALTDGFVCISRDIHAELGSVGMPDRRLWDIPNGVDTEHFRPADAQEQRELRATLGLPDGPLIVFAGRLVVEKCVDVLIRALPTVLQQVPDASIVLLGEGDQQAALQSLAAEVGVAKRVIFAGAHDDVAPFLRAADMFVLPSRAEGFPVSLLEAMSTGLSCVATNISGTSQLLEDGVGGRLVAVDDPQALARGIVEGLTSAEADGWRQRARQHIVDLYSLDAIADRYIDMYHALLEPSSAARPARFAER